MKQVFEYTDYRKYLIDRLGGHGKRTGLRRKACAYLGCHSTYLSHVLSEKIHLSLEHAEALNSFFKHTREQAEFFLLLVLKARAGTKSLREHFESKIQELLERRNVIKNRIQNATSLSEEDLDRFYSSWLYGALHVLVSIKEYQTVEALSHVLGLHPQKLTEELEFMQKTGLIKHVKGRYTVGPKFIHLSSDSNAITKHHTNWRYHTIQHLNRRQAKDLHYSAVISLSEEAAQEIRESLLQTLEKHMAIIQKAKEEVVYVHNFDFYRLA